MLVPLLELLSLCAAGMMAGAVVYTSMVEIPVRASLSGPAQIDNWQRVYPKAHHLLKPFGIALMPLLIVTGILSGVWLWYAATFFLLLLIPFTAISLQSINTQLLALGPDDDPEVITALVQDWGKMHNIRTMITLLAFGCALLANLWGKL